MSQMNFFSPYISFFFFFFVFLFLLGLCCILVNRCKYVIKKLPELLGDRSVAKSLFKFELFPFFLLSFFFYTH